MSDRLTALIDSLDQKSEATLRELEYVRKRLQLLEGENNALKAQLEQQQIASPVVAQEVSVAGAALAEPESSVSAGAGESASLPLQATASRSSDEHESPVIEHDSGSSGAGSTAASNASSARCNDASRESPSSRAEVSEETTAASGEAAAQHQPGARNEAAPDQPLPSPQALLKQWYARYPHAFFTAHTKPLKIGIHEDLIAREPWPAKLIRRALANYVNLPRYLKSVRVGVQRVDLDGQPAGDIVEQDVLHAKEQLDVLQQRRREREEKQSAERMSRKLAELNARLGH